MLLISLVFQKKMLIPWGFRITEDSKDLVLPTSSPSLSYKCWSMITLTGKGRPNLIFWNCLHRNAQRDIESVWSKNKDNLDWINQPPTHCHSSPLANTLLQLIPARPCWRLSSRDGELWSKTTQNSPSSETITVTSPEELIHSTSAESTSNPTVVT